jgi:small subunit ribosomal protein S8
MSLSDPLGDLLTRIRNAQRARQSRCIAPASKLRENVLDVLKREGLHPRLRHRAAPPGREGHQHRAEVFGGRAGHQGDPPGLEARPARLFQDRGAAEVYSGLGISILSTPKGVMSDHEARTANVGGEVLCRVF